MKKIIKVLLVLGILACLCSCTDKKALEREIRQQQIDNAKENLEMIDGVEKQQDKVKDLLDQLS